ncbi:RNA-binding protein, partial [Vibrio sp. 10N.222.48.A3]
MNSKKSMLLIVALAVLGGIVFSQVDISPAITFILGVLASAFVVNFSSTNSKSESEPKASTKTLYVGNLPYKANESHVRELFSEYGEVFAVRLMKD